MNTIEWDDHEFINHFKETGKLKSSSFSQNLCITFYAPYVINYNFYLKSFPLIRTVEGL